MPINMLLEAFKWKVLLNDIFPVSIQNALYGVLAGYSFGIVTPHGLGDYIGRAGVLPSDYRPEAVAAVFFSRIAQFAITLLVGCFGVFFHYNLKNPIILEPYILEIVSLSISLLILFFLFRKKLLSRLNILVNHKSIKDGFVYAKNLSNRKIVLIIGISLIRYLTFSLQLLIALKMLDVPGDLLTLGVGISLIFLIKSIIPSFFELGVRESAILWYFGAISPTGYFIPFAGLMVWIVNLFLPSLIGTWFVWKYWLRKN